MAGAFCGVYELIKASGEAKDMWNSAFANVVNKVTFHSGLTESALASTFRRARCILKVEKAENKCYFWNVSYGDETLGIGTKIKLMEEFDVTMPITGENIKGTCMYFKAEKQLKQTLTFPNSTNAGIGGGGGGGGLTIDLSYKLTMKGLAVTMTRRDTSVSGQMSFLRIS